MLWDSFFNILSFSRDLFFVCEKSYCNELAGGATPFAFQLCCQLDMAMYLASASQRCSPILTEFSGECGYLLVFLSLFPSLVIDWL